MLFEINWGFVFTIINLLVLYLLLKKFLFGPVRGIMEQREQLIQSRLSSAEDEKQQALALKGQYEAAMADAGSQAQAILQRARDQGQEEYQAILRDAGAEAKRVMKEAKQEIEKEREKNMRLLSAEIAGLAVTAAEKAVKSSNGSFDEEIMDEFLREEGVFHD